MKKIYICAVLGLFFASCSTDEGNKESTQEMKTVNVAKQVDLYNIINEIDASCTASSYKSTEEMINYVNDIALANADFKMLDVKGYVSPTVEEVEFLMNNDEAIVLEQLNYNAATNYYLNQMLVVKGPWATNPVEDKNLSNKDRILLDFLSRTWGPDDDWEWDRRKPIAFVTGYKDSLTRAIIFTVLSEQALKVEQVDEN